MRAGGRTLARLLETVVRKSNIVTDKIVERLYISRGHLRKGLLHQLKWVKNTSYCPCLEDVSVFGWATFHLFLGWSLFFFYRVIVMSVKASLTDILVSFLRITCLE